MKHIINFHILSGPDGHLLKWVGTVKNRTSFVVLRSTNALDFDLLDEIDLTKATGEPYEYLDEEAPNTKTYYQVQYLDGKEVLEVSPVLNVGESEGFNLKNFLIRLFVAVGLIALAVMLIGKLSKKEPQPMRAAIEQRKQYVKTEKVDYKNFKTSIEALGKVIASQPIDIVSEVGGKIEKGDVILKKATTFKKGDLLFRIDQEETLLGLKAQRSNYLNAIALILADMKLDFPNSYDKWQNYFNSINLNSNLPPMPEPADQRERTFLASKNIAGQYYNIKSQEERMTKYLSYAPYNGIIQSVYTDAGSVANPGTRVLRVRKTSDLELELPVRKEDIKWVKPGTSVKIFSEDRSQTTTGAVNRLGSEIDATTQSVNVYIRLNPSRIKLYEGLYLYAEVAGSSIAKAMEINRDAIIDNNKIFVIKDSILYKKSVNIHKVNTETVLFSGLKEGEVIIKDVFLGAVDGMKVVPMND